MILQALDKMKNKILVTTYFVTLNILSKRKARSTDRPNEACFTSVQITSKMEPQITTQSKRLNDDSKYIRGPNAYILMNISIMKRPRNTNSAISEKDKKCIINIM